MVAVNRCTCDVKEMLIRINHKIPVKMNVNHDTTEMFSNFNLGHNGDKKQQVGRSIYLF